MAGGSTQQGGCRAQQGRAQQGGCIAQRRPFQREGRADRSTHEAPRGQRALLQALPSRQPAALAPRAPQTAMPAGQPRSWRSSSPLQSSSPLPLCPCAPAVGQLRARSTAGRVLRCGRQGDAAARKRRPAIQVAACTNNPGSFPSPASPCRQGLQLRCPPYRTAAGGAI